MHRRLVVPLVAAAMLGVAGCGGAHHSESSARPTTPTSPPPASSAATTSTSVARSAAVKVTTRVLPRLGRVLVTSQGRTLYTFAPDHAKRVTCVAGCAGVWPPLQFPKAVGSGGVKASLLGSDPNPGGGRVITYAGWPLYTYTVDRSPGSHLGQAQDLDGGHWYVISPSGKVIKTKP